MDDWKLHADLLSKIPNAVILRVQFTYVFKISELSHTSCEVRNQIKNR